MANNPYINKVIVGNETKLDLTGDTVAADKLLSGVTAHDMAGAPVVGTMPNNGAVSGKITAKAQAVSIARGYHDGSGSVAIDATEQAKIIAGNIKSGVTILGVVGTLSAASGVTAQSKTVTPGFAEQVVLPGEGYDYLSQVTVAAIPVTETDNAAGGVTLTVGA